MRITSTEVYGIDMALIGMRNPMDSHHLRDTYSTGEMTDSNGIIHEDIKIGENDLNLAQRLIAGGSEHCKFLRQIHVWANLRLPRYIWSELDTYHYNTKNSESTMHRLFNVKKPITLDLFYYDEDDIEEIEELNRDIAYLNKLRDKWLIDKKFCHVAKAKRKLPESFLQMRTMDTNYAELRNIYFQRKNHRLKDEWGVICKWIESLPYAKELIIYEK